jgi:glycosyltransferase involved in cell wall biosynthesis
MNIVIGQENVSFRGIYLTPLKRLSYNLEGFCLTEPGYDLIHVMNSIPLAVTCPFIITVEDFLPRMWPRSALSRWFFERLRARLLKPECARLLFMSRFGIRQFQVQNRGYDRLAAIEEKIELFYPTTPVRRTMPKKPGKVLTILTVANEFMRKGVPAVLRAHEILRGRGVAVETHIVSALRWSPADYFGPPSQALVDDAKRRLGDEGVRFHGAQPNTRVLALMEECDFFVLPTFQDSFGYVSIEALAGGTPVIASAMGAQPEIVEENGCGYLLPIEVDPEVGKWIWIDRAKEPGYVEAYADQSERFALAIADRLEAHAGAHDEYERLSAGALDQLRKRFDRDKARQRLETLYASVCGRAGYRGSVGVAPRRGPISTG